MSVLSVVPIKKGPSRTSNAFAKIETYILYIHIFVSLGGKKIIKLRKDLKTEGKEHFIFLATNLYYAVGN